MSLRNLNPETQALAVDIDAACLDTAGSALQGATYPRQGNIPT
jgi:hypothetical protein